VQVDPIKPSLKAPGIKRLKLKYDKPLSNFAFKFNLRRYTMVGRAVEADEPLMDAGLDSLSGRGLHSSTFRINVSIFCGIRWLHD
jgi:hypothetical protein